MQALTWTTYRVTTFTERVPHLMHPNPNPNKSAIIPGNDDERWGTPLEIEKQATSKWVVNVSRAHIMGKRMASYSAHIKNQRNMTGDSRVIMVDAIRGGWSQILIRIRFMHILCIAAMCAHATQVNPLSQQKQYIAHDAR